MPPRKRQRNEKQVVQSKRGRLPGFMSLPMDVFTMIVSYFFPLDLLYLARSNTVLRDILMSRSSSHIWISAMKNVEGLPLCPSTMSEPQYVALLFTTVCSGCGAASRSEVNEYLLVRLCDRCACGELIQLAEIREELRELVHYSTKGWGGYDVSPQLIGTTTRTESRETWDEYSEIDKEALETWVEQRRTQVASRRKLGDELRRFLHARKLKEREAMLELIEIRRTQIEERLLALGWEKEDIEINPFNSGRALKWHNLVEVPKQPKLLTDRTWKNLYAKLLPILEDNREERLESERSQLEASRRQCLKYLLRKIKRREAPLLKVKPRKLVPGEHLFDRPRAQYDVFPFAQDAVDCGFVQDLGEEYPTIDEFQKALEDHRAEIDAWVSEWQDETRTYLADLIREEEVEYYELLQPPKNMDPDAFGKLSDDQKLLLRADSLFYIGHEDHDADYNILNQPYDYDEALRTITPDHPVYSDGIWDYECCWESEALPLNTICLHPAAQEVARDLLEDLDKSNASFLEVNQLHYSCERCHDKKPRNWTGIIQHYLEQKHINARIQAQASVLAQKRIIYNDVHAPGDSPMIKPCKTKDSTKFAVRKCALCIRKPISLNVIASRTKINKHLREVHAVDKPKLNDHYCIPMSSSRSGRPGIGYDYEEGEEDHEEVEADNGLEERVESEVEYVYVVGEDSDDEEESENDGEVAADS